MSKIHVSVAGANPIQYEETLVRSMLLDGTLRGDALFWRPGMADWKPLRELPPAAPAEAPGAVAQTDEPTVATYTFTKDPRGVNRFLLASLWVHLAILIVAIVSDFGQLSLLTGGTFTQEAAEANDARQMWVGIAVAAVAVTSIIGFLRWLYIANVNCRGFGASDMEFKPGMCVINFFIPFVNLIRPYLAVQEIWKVSNGPKNWRMQRRSSLVGWWWALWLLSNFVAQAVLRMTFAPNGAPDAEALTKVSIASGFIDVTTVLVMRAMVSDLIDRQLRLVQSSGKP